LLRSRTADRNAATGETCAVDQSFPKLLVKIRGNPADIEAAARQFAVAVATREASGRLPRH
jgi:hypothetical protein